MNQDDLRKVREWVGSQPADVDVEEVWDRVGDVEGTALSILRQRRADLLSAPETWAVAGEYSQSTGRNLEYLNGQIAALEKLTGTTGVDVIDTVQLLRCDTGR